MTIKIPQQLQNENFKFILLKNKEKTPISGVRWNKFNYKYNDKELVKHSYNYGVVGGDGNLRIIDIDNKELGKKLLEILDTFTIKTCGGNYHFYVITPYNKNHKFIDDKGEFRANNYYVVGPGCYVIDKKKKYEGSYDIIKDIPIKVMTKDEVLKIINPFLTQVDSTSQEQIVVDKDYLDKNILPKITTSIRSLITEKKKSEELKSLGYPSRSERDQRVITSLLLQGYGQFITSIFENYPVGEKYRSHPSKERYLEHSIKGGRVYSGVKDDSIPILEKEIDNLTSTLLRNKIDEYLTKIMKIKSLLIQKYFISNIAFKTKINKIELGKRLKELQSINEIKNPISIQDLLKKDMPEIEYWMYPLIPKNSLLLFGGKPGQFKSMFILSVALALKDNKAFLDNFEIKNTPKILLYDLENGDKINWWRTNYLLKGLNIDSKKLTNFHIEDNFNKENIEKEIELSKKYDIIILDSYRRFLKGTESDSEITDKFFQEYLNPLKKQGKTIIIVHHFKKAKLDEMSDDELMDLFRGSSDIPAQFDLIMGMFKGVEVQEVETTNTLFDIYLAIVKNRLGLPIRNFSFRVTKDDKNQSTSFKFLDFKKMMSPKERTKELILKTLEKSGKELSRVDIIKAVTSEIQVSESIVIKHLLELTKDNTVLQPKYGRYSLAIEDRENVDLTNFK